MPGRVKPTGRVFEGSEDEKDLKKVLDEASWRVAHGKDYLYIRSFLEELIRNNAIPIELLEFIPVLATEAGKTRFDQIFDAAMSLVFPDYKTETLRKLLGPRQTIPKELKIWRIAIPEKFGIAHVLIRANSMQDAFALGCDYACRVSLRVHKKIPVDLTVRVIFVSEVALRRRLEIRWASRVIKRTKYQLEARVFTPKEVVGARMAALGHAKDPMRSIVNYMEYRDMYNILKTNKSIKVSSVENETLKGGKLSESNKRKRVSSVP